VPIVVYKVHRNTFSLTLVIISLLFSAHLSSPLEVFDSPDQTASYLSVEVSFYDPAPGCLQNKTAKLPTILLVSACVAFMLLE
jgi:hypothetical protein